MEDKAYKVSAKRLDTGRWWTFGNLKKTSYGNFSIGLRVTEELKNLIRAKNDGEYVNFSLFEDDADDKTKHEKAKQDGYQPQPELDDEIPF